MSNIETPTAHAEAASQFLTQLRTMLQSISGFAHVTPGRRRRINPTASVRDAFLQTVAVALDSSDVLASAAQVRGPDLRDAVSFKNAFEPVAVELELAARGLRETIATRRSDAGTRALRAYSMAKSLNRPSDRELLIPHIRDMARTLNRGRRRQPVVEPDPAPEAPGAPQVTQ